MLPPVSLPIAKATNPAAVAAPGPALEPDDPSSSNHGFIVCPPNQMWVWPDVIERQRSQTQLGYQHRTRRMQTFHNHSVLRGHAVSQRLGAIGRRNSGCIEKIFCSPRDAMQRTAVLSGGDLGVGLFSLSEREVTCQGDDAAQFGIELLQTLQINLSEAFRAKFALLDPARELYQRGEGNIFVGYRQGSRIGATAHTLVPLRTCLHPWQHRVPLGRRSERRFQRHFPRARASLVQGGHIRTPAAAASAARFARQLPAASARSDSVISI